MLLSSRRAVKSDCPFILKMIKQLASFERAPDKVIVSVEQLEKDGFGEHPLFFAEILEYDSIPAGFFLYYFRYSTWKGKSLYLEDIYVKPEYRRKGLARLAFFNLCKIAQKESCGRFEWQVLDWNESAIKFYQEFNTELDPEWINCRLEGDSINRVISDKVSDAAF